MDPRQVHWLAIPERLMLVVPDHRIPLGSTGVPFVLPECDHPRSPIPASVVAVEHRTTHHAGRAEVTSARRTSEWFVWVEFDTSTHSSHLNLRVGMWEWVTLGRRFRTARSTNPRTRGVTLHKELFRYHGSGCPTVHPCHPSPSLCPDLTRNLLTLDRRGWVLEYHVVAAVVPLHSTQGATNGPPLGSDRRGSATLHPRTLPVLPRLLPGVATPPTKR